MKGTIDTWLVIIFGLGLLIFGAVSQVKDLEAYVFFLTTGAMVSMVGIYELELDLDLEGQSSR